MEIDNVVRVAVANEQVCAVVELGDLELAVVGGGTGDISLG